MPRVKLTDRSIKTLLPKNGKQTDYFDKTFPNFAVRVSPKGRKSFCVFYRIGRRFTRQTLGTYPTPLGLAEARQEARKALYRVDIKGEDPSRDRQINREAITFDELANEFLDKHSKGPNFPEKPRKRSWKEDQRIITRNLTPIIGKLRAKDVSRPIVRELLDDIAETSPIMANRIKALISTIFNWAIRRDILESNPCSILELPGGPERKRDRVLSDDEIRRVWLASEKESVQVSSMIKFRMLTGQRGGEVASMRWSDVDFDNAVWMIPAELSKNANMHRLPLSPEAVRLLTSLKAHADETAKEKERVSAWVFPGRKGGTSPTEVQKIIQRVRAHTKGENPNDKPVSFRGHDLRRTTASKMTELGIPRLIVKKILNHADTEITAVYDRFAYDKEKREALELWARRLAVITSGLKVAAATNTNA